MELIVNWEPEKGNGFSQKEDCVQVLSGKARFIPPHTWTKLYLPFSITVLGTVTLVSAIHRACVVSGVSSTPGGQMRVDVYNASDEVLTFTPTTPVINIFGVRELRITGGKEKVRRANQCSMEITEKSLRKEICETFPIVFDHTKHEITEKMAEMAVRRNEVPFPEPPELGVRTQYCLSSAAGRSTVQSVLEEYEQKGYLRSASKSESVYLSPLLPNGKVRLTNDYRKLNGYFRTGGTPVTSHSDSWTKLWEIDPEWRYFAKVDLKDAFFSIPLSEEIQRYFGFTFGERTFVWKRLPQGFLWASTLFSERAAEVVAGLAVQFADDLLVGARSLQELREKLLLLFKRLAIFGMKANEAKIEWVTQNVTFLGYEITPGGWSLKKYLDERESDIGEISSSKDLQRIIGILSYCRRAIPDMERRVSPLRAHVAQNKVKRYTKEEWKKAEADAKLIFREALRDQLRLAVPGTQAYYGSDRSSKTKVILGHSNNPTS